jgi:uncharacterized protein
VNRSATPRQVFERLQRSVRENDRSAVVDLMAPDGTMEYPFAVPGVPSVIRGRDEIRAVLGATRAASVLRLEELDATIHDTGDPEVIVAECELRGTVAATGAPFRLPSIGVIRVRDGQIVSYRDYVNPLGSATVTGRLPELFAALTANAG